MVLIMPRLSMYLPDLAYFDKSDWSAYCSKGFHKGCKGSRRSNRLSVKKGTTVKCECPCHRRKK